MMRRIIQIFAVLCAAFSSSSYAAQSYTTQAAAVAACWASVPSGTFLQSCNQTVDNAPYWRRWRSVWHTTGTGSGVWVNGSEFDHALQGCPSGTTADVDGLCVANPPPCPEGQTRNAQGVCEAPVTCAEGQTNISGSCVPDSAAPTPGSSASTSGVQIGTADASGNVSHNGTWDTVMGGGTVSMNCGGWECTISASEYDNSGIGCYTVAGVASCNFNPKYTGQPATPSLPVSVAPSGGSNAPLPTVGCPAGYTLNATTGLCTSGTAPGTASTTTTPSTAPTAGIATCPTGYQLDAAGNCSGAPAATLGGGAATCPTGYTLNASGQCQGTATIGADGSPTGSGGNGSGAATCGGPGQPSCNVTLEGPSSLAPINDATWTPGGENALTNAFNDVNSGVADGSYNLPGAGAMAAVQAAFTDWFDPIPASGCAPFHINVSFIDYTLDHCPTAEKISVVMGYALWFYLLVGTFISLTGRKET